MPQRIVYGNINADASKYSGTTDFDVHHIEKGTYEITFRPAFSSVPTVVLTQNFPSWDGSGNPGDTRDNAVLIAVDERASRYATGGAGGDRVDRNCGFIAIGDVESD